MPTEKKEKQDLGYLSAQDTHMYLYMFSISTFATQSEIVFN